jgi:cytochrome bd-type quinol oxidase subunit 2
MDKFDSFIVSSVVFLAVTVLIIVSDKEKVKLIMKMFQNQTFLVSLLIIVIYSFIVLTSKNNDEKSKNLKKATKQAILGFIIAIFAYLDMIIAPFWVIWLTSYYLDV